VTVTPSKSSCTTNSFTPGTPVLMADGTQRPIEEIEVGDHVLATDPETGRTEAKPVERLITGEGVKHLVTITVDTDGAAGSTTVRIVATEGHPFWVQAERRWVDAGDLLPGTWLRTSAGTHVEISAVDKYTARTRVHNLTVRDIHTYYVLAGGRSVLVHNCGTAGRVDPNDLRFSQTTAGGRGRAQTLRDSMGQRGWDGDPVDVVQTSDGLTTIDNTRVAVAQELGIREIPVTIHLPTAPLPQGMMGRFGSAKTWGEALIYRTSRQQPPLGPTGTATRPRMPS